MEFIGNMTLLDFLSFVIYYTEVLPKKSQTKENNWPAQEKNEKNDSSLKKFRTLVAAIIILAVSGICFFAYTVRKTKKENEAAAKPEDPVINFDDNKLGIPQISLQEITKDNKTPRQERSEDRPINNNETNDIATDDVGTMLYIGERFEKGTDTEVNYEKAFFYYSKAAEAGNPTALNKVGNMYAQGKGCPKNPYKAAQYYQAAAEMGDKYAQHNIAFCYWDGVGVKKNHELAIMWMQRSAAQGYKKARQALSVMEAP